MGARDGGELGLLLVTIGTMAVSAFVAGALPYWFKIKESRVALMAALGGGLLIGTALAVLIPEGFHAFAGAQAHTGSHGHDDHEHHDHDHDGHDGHEHGVPEGLTGLALVTGFLCMLLLDHLQHAAGGSHSLPGQGHSHGGHRHGGKGGDRKCSGDLSAGPSPPPQRQQKQQQEEDAGAVGAAAGAAEPAPGKAPASPAPGAGGAAERAVTGLLIHCAADGLAVGAAALAGNARLSLMIGVAMVLHKAPMAFGLATYLLGCAWPWPRARRTLAAFSAAAPLSALATYVLLGRVPALTSPTAVALCVLFSGGTFLYAAAMHILPEILGSCGAASGGQLAAVAVGSLLPVALSWGHSH